MELFYNQDQDLVEDQVEAVFGDAKIYYDNANILGDVAILKCGCSFLEVQPFISLNIWKVDLRVESVVSNPQGRK